MAISLSAIKEESSRPTETVNIVVYGVNKIGKSSLAQEAPRPIFADVEDGTKELKRVERFPRPDVWTWAYLMECVDFLLVQDHPYQSLVLDTLDWIEPLAFRELIRIKPTHQDGRKVVEIQTIDDYPYFAGYTMVLDVWRLLLAKLEKLRRVRKMNIIALAHSNLRMVENAMGSNYEQWDLAINKHAAGMWRQWTDAVLYAAYELAVTKDDPSNKRGKGKGVGSGKRLLYTEEMPAYRAGNRYSLPPIMSLSWREFWATARGDSRETVESITERIREMVQGTELAEKAARGLMKYTDAASLRGFENWLKNQIKVQDEQNSQG
jgi:hypothetical protein